MADIAATEKHERAGPPREQQRPEDESATPSQAVALDRRGAGSDLEAARAAVAAVQAGEERLRVTLMSIGEAVVCSDAEGAITLTNPAAEALTGWPAQGAIGRPCDQVVRMVSEGTRAPVEDPVRSALMSGRPVRMDSHHVLVGRDGRERYVEATATPVLGETRTVEGAVLVLRDVTGRVLAERASRLQEERWKLALRLSKVGLWRWDARTGEVEWDETLEEVYGLAPGTFGGNYQAFIERVHPEDREQLATRVSEVIAAADDQEYSVRFRTVRPDGEIRWVADRARVLKDDTGAVVGITGVCWDDTRQRAHEEAIVELNERLQRAMAETHHRVKNSLQLVAALVEAKADEELGNVPADALRLVSNHIRSIGDIHDLLTLESRAHAESAELDLFDMFARLITGLRAMAGSREISVHSGSVRVPQRQATAVAIVANELVTNAVKHGEGAIRVKLTARDATAVLEVSDCGPGFPDGFRMGAQKTLGLDLVQTLVRVDLRGSVAAINQPGGGACVRVEFPAGKQIP